MVSRRTWRPLSLRDSYVSRRILIIPRRYELTPGDVACGDWWRRVAGDVFVSNTSNPSGSFSYIHPSSGSSSAICTPFGCVCLAASAPIFCRKLTPSVPHPTRRYVIAVPGCVFVPAPFSPQFKPLESGTYPRSPKRFWWSKW